MKLNRRARLLAGASNALLLSLAVAPAARAQANAASSDTAAAAPAVSEVVVRSKEQSGAKVQLQSVGPLGNRSILDTPMSISAVDTAQINRVAATTIDAAFNYDASVRPNNSGVASGNTFASRGQTVDLTFGYRYDGLAFPYWFQDQPIESLDSIQVLKGTGGFVYGYASPAGVVNFVSKKPTSEFQTIVDLSFRSSNIWRALIDVGGPFTPGGATAFRLNVVNEQGTLYNGAYNSDRFVSLWLQGEITPKLTWSVNGFAQRTLQSHESNSIALGPGVTRLAPVDGGQLNLGSPSSRKQNDVSQVTGRVNYEITPDWKVSGALRYAVLDERFPGNSAQITNNNGAYRLGLLDQNRLFYYYVGQFTVDGKFNTGPIQHNIIAGFDYLDDVFDYDYEKYTSTHIPTTSFGFGLTGNIYNGQNSAPSWDNNAAAIAYQRPPNWAGKYQEIVEKGLFISDTLTWGPAELLIGGRYTFFHELDRPYAYLDAYGNLVPSSLPSPNTRDPAITNKTTLTPVIAPSFRIADGVRVYASYVQALQTGVIVPFPYANEGAILAPLLSTQWEVGIKAQRSNWGATLAAFRTTSPSDGPGPGNLYVQNAEVRYQGIEFDGNYRFNREWLVDASFAYLDAQQTKASLGALIPVGQQLPETVNYRATAFVEYSPSYLPGFRAFGGVRYTGQTHGQNHNTFYFPSSTVGDIGVSYQLPTRQNIEVRANVQNVTNLKYWIPGSSATAISAGAPRTFTVSIAYKGGHGRGGADGANVFNSAYGGWYVGLEGGGVLPDDGRYALLSRLHPNLDTSDGLDVKRKAGGEVSGVIGRNWGLFRTEVETNYSWAALKQVTLNNTAIPIENTDLPGSAPTAGVYNSPRGSTTVIAFLANGLINLGGGKNNPWSVEAGGGIGLGVVRSNDKWALKSTGRWFQDDSASGFAWQALARVRRRITDHVDVSLSYHYLAVPTVTLRTGTDNYLRGGVAESGLRGGVTYNF